MTAYVLVFEMDGSIATEIRDALLLHVGLDPEVYRRSQSQNIGDYMRVTLPSTTADEVELLAALYIEPHGFTWFREEVAPWPGADPASRTSTASASSAVTAGAATAVAP
jgi:hypothetical protein